MPLNIFHFILNDNFGVRVCVHLGHWTYKKFFHTGYKQYALLLYEIACAFSGYLEESMTCHTGCRKTAFLLYAWRVGVVLGYLT